MNSISFWKKGKFCQMFSFFAKRCQETYFYLIQPLNKQNNRFRSDSQPYLGVEIPLKDEKFDFFRFGKKVYFDFKC